MKTWFASKDNDLLVNIKRKSRLNVITVFTESECKMQDK